jgi:hypothetical protein
LAQAELGQAGLMPRPTAIPAPRGWLCLGAVGERFADEASRALALALAVRIAERTAMSEHLQTALASRAVIDQALGIIMGQNRCTADNAFEELIAAGVDVRTVAGRLGHGGGGATTPHTAHGWPRPTNERPKP